MADRNGVAYEDLEIRIDDKPGKDGVNVQETLRRLHFQKNDRYHQVPTEDSEVKRLLSVLGEAESRTGEDEYSRRQRLIDLLVSNQAHMDTFEATLLNKQLKATESESYEDEEEDEEEEEFYTPASPDLVEARKFLVGFSINNARKRLEKEIQDAIRFDIKKEINERRNISCSLKNLVLSGSQVASTRPVSHIKLSPDAAYAAVCSWDGSLKTISTNNLQIVSSVDQAHVGKVGEADWNAAGDLLATGGEDGLVKVFSSVSGKLRTSAVFQGHERRVAGTKVHQSGRFIASASFDKTWRLWDIRTQKELLLQEGHSKEVYCIAFHPDGSLLCSGGFDCTPMLWDIRSGKCAMSLQGHTKPVYSVDWSPNGYHLATASGDGTINIWDIRKSSQAETILAHDSTISVVRFAEPNGKFLISGSYDRDIKVFSSDSWLNVAVLKGHSDKILSLDIALDGNMILSGGWDRSVKLWTKN